VFTLSIQQGFQPVMAIAVNAGVIPRVYAAVSSRIQPIDLRTTHHRGPEVAVSHRV
jgi:hypothetical protein